MLKGGYIVCEWLQAFLASVLLYAPAESFSVSRIKDFFFIFFIFNKIFIYIFTIKNKFGVVIYFLPSFLFCPEIQPLVLL